jgi:hypothetical protein
LNEFTPAEAERITGLPQATKRDWVRREFLSKTSGHARYTVRPLAEMFMLRLMSEHGLGPDRFKPIAMLAAQGLLYYALRVADHYEGTLDAIEGFCDLKNEPQVKVMKKLGYTGQRPKKYMVIWADQNVTFTEDLNGAFGVDRDNSGRDFISQEGPVLVFSLQMLAVKFRGLDHKPFVRVANTPNPRLALTA